MRWDWDLAPIENGTSLRLIWLTRGLNLIFQELDEEANRILEGLEQIKMEKGGKKAGIGKFAHASLDKNKKLGMFESEKEGE